MGLHKNMRPTIRQLRLKCHLELRRRGKSLQLQMGIKQFTRWEEKMFAKQMFAIPCRDDGTQRGI